MSGALLLASCGGSDSGGSDAKTLKLWHYESANGAMGIAWDKAIEIFKKEHPDVTVDFERKAFEQIQQNAGMIISSDEGPDIMEYNKGNATAGLLASQGLLTDLSEQATARGWDTTLPPSLQTTAKYDEKGVMGSGNWYGVPNYGEYVMVYYNKDVFAANGIAVPTTLDEFTAAMDKFVAAGVTPLCMAGAEYPAGAAGLPARADQGRPLVRRRLPALQEPGRLPGRSAEVRRRHLRSVGQEGLHLTGLGVVEGRGHGHRVHRRQVRDDRLR